MNDLSPEMQSRLEKWRANPQPVKSAALVRGQSPGNYVQRQGDYGDDIRDFERKQDNAWSKELYSNPVYRGYR